MSDKRVLHVPRSACVTDGDRIEIRGREAVVLCRNGKAKISPPFKRRSELVLGTRTLTLDVKEITTESEFQGYEQLAALHYRNQAKHGRASVLVATVRQQGFPPVVGYIELGSPLYMSKPRTRFFDAPFKNGTVEWTAWDSTTTRKYLGLFVRISRCVVAPEFRGLGIGSLLVETAAQFAKSRWHHSGYRPLFLEISADMLRFVPFTKKAGFTYIGETEGNLSRVATDMDYLTRNAKRVRSKEIVREDSFGIVDRQVTRMNSALRLMRRHGLSRQQLVEKLKNLSRTKVLRDFALLSDLVSLPKPTLVLGLTPEARRFIESRSQQLGSQALAPTQPQVAVEPLSRPLVLEGVSAVFNTTIRRNARTHAIQQAFGISPESLTSEVLREVSLSIEPGSITVITGPSGAGKTVLLDVIAGTLRSGLSLRGKVRRPRNMTAGYLQPLTSRQSLIEIFGHPDAESGIRALSQVGLSDAYLYLRRFEELSAGQQYRAMLADLIRRRCNLAIIDEFCSTLDSVTAHTVAASLERLVRTTGLTAVLAAPHTTLFIDAISPQKLVTLSSFGNATVTINKK